jgi:hypothetical protein
MLALTADEAGNTCGLTIKGHDPEHVKQFAFLGTPPTRHSKIVTDRGGAQVGGGERPGLRANVNC